MLQLVSFDKLNKAIEYVKAEIKINKTYRNLAIYKASQQYGISIDLLSKEMNKRSSAKRAKRINYYSIN